MLVWFEPSPWIYALMTVRPWEMSVFAAYVEAKGLTFNPCALRSVYCFHSANIFRDLGKCQFA